MYRNPIIKYRYIMSNSQTRKIKIHTKLTGNKSVCIKKSELILSGLWLENCGFKPGKMVNVEANQGQLVITLASPDGIAS